MAEHTPLTEIGEADLTDAFRYLDVLRESGVTNMYAATPYVIRDCGMKRPVAMLRRVQRAALIATFRKLAEDGPTEALQLVLDDMTDEACAGWRVVCRALLRELEDLTP